MVIGVVLKELEATLFPAALMALTRTTYEVPLVNPETVYVIGTAVPIETYEPPFSEY